MIKSNKVSSRIQKLRRILQEQSIDALLVSHPKQIVYLSKYNGFSDTERDAYIIVTKQNQYLFTNPLYETAVKQQVSDFQIISSSYEHPFKKSLHSLFFKNKVKTVGFDETNLSVKEFQNIQFPKVDYIPVPFSDMRIQKSSEEIDRIQKACDLTDKAFSYIIKHITSGITEKQLATELEFFIKKNNAELSFPTIVAFGENAATPHHHTGETKLKNRDLILIDFGVRLNDYCSDMTRTFFVGKPTNEQRKAYDVVLDSQRKAIDYMNQELRIKNHAKARNVDEVSRKYICTQGYPSIPHSLGHGIGLEVHEAPSLSPHSDYLLTNGMAFSIEPGIYIPNKFGIRIEDLYAIKNNTLIRLTNSVSDLISL